MSQFAVDGQGKRIKTDILVYGYIRDINKKFKLLIPDDINKICFEYWLITVCDEWDKHYLSSEHVEIDESGATVKSIKAGVVSIYGCRTVDKGVYSWQIKLMMNVAATSRWFCMGVIQDKHGILERFKQSYMYVEHHGCCLHNDGRFYRGSASFGKDYMDRFKVEEEIIILMTLDMDNHTLSYKVNDKDYGIVTDQLGKDRYRLVISFHDENYIVELL